MSSLLNAANTARRVASAEAGATGTGGTTLTPALLARCGGMGQAGGAGVPGTEEDMAPTPR
eukprot:15479086-Alexandrium_andersonii.AAC.1